MQANGIAGDHHIGAELLRLRQRAPRQIGSRKCRSESQGSSRSWNSIQPVRPVQPPQSPAHRDLRRPHTPQPPNLTAQRRPRSGRAPATRRHWHSAQGSPPALPCVGLRNIFRPLQMTTGISSSSHVEVIEHVLRPLVGIEIDVEIGMTVAAKEFPQTQCCRLSAWIPAGRHYRPHGG